MYRVLAVEDDLGILTGIKDTLLPWDIEVSGISDFKNIIGEFSDYRPHLVLMDISLPFMDGYYFCKEIRKISSVPIVFISSVSDNMNIVMAINMGGDDFISKPFDRGVLLAKVQAILRRAYDLNNSAPIIEHKGAVLNIGDGTLIYDGNNIELTKNEYRILLTLLQSKGKIVSREKLMQALWETESFVDENTLTVNVGRLRKKLETAGLKDFITTKFGMGYIIS